MTLSRPPSELTHVIAATDFSELGDRAVLSGLRLANAQARAQLNVIAVAVAEGDGMRLPWGDLSQPVSWTDAQQQVQARVAKLIAPEAEGAEAHVESIALYLTVGNPAECIVDLAHRIDADLIVVGTHGRTGFKRLLLGSVAEAVVRTAPCGVLVIRPRDFSAGVKVPDVEPPLAPGAHSLKPFHHGLTHHYVDKASMATSRMLPAG